MSEVDEDGWTVRYGCYRRDFGRILSLSFGPPTRRGEKGYLLRLAGADLEARPEKAIEAKKILLKTAIKWYEDTLPKLKEALAKLEKK